MSEYLSKLNETKGCFSDSLMLQHAPLWFNGEERGNKILRNSVFSDSLTSFSVVAEASPKALRATACTHTDC